MLLCPSHSNHISLTYDGIETNEMDDDAHLPYTHKHHTLTDKLLLNIVFGVYSIVTHAYLMKL